MFFIEFTLTQNIILLIFLHKVRGKDFLLCFETHYVNVA